MSTTSTGKPDTQVVAWRVWFQIRRRGIMGFMYDLDPVLRDIRNNIDQAARRSGRSGRDVTIMAVTKTHGFQAAQAALDQGLVLLGENRVQESLEKFPPPESRKGYRLHLIGHLQKNKARKAARFFDAIQSIDDLETLSLLESECATIGRTLEVVLEMNTSMEASKHGVKDPDSLRRLLELLLSMPHLKACGLMTLGPLGNDESANRRAFSSLKNLFDRLGSEFSPPDWSVLSMGMSQDYVQAVEEGSNLVRLGTVLFGGRS